jgi:hypothetical protein
MRWMWGVVGLAIAILAVAAGVVMIALGSSSTPVAELELGDCFDLPSPDAAGGSVQMLERVDVIDCDRPHQAEVVLVGELNTEQQQVYPNDAELFEHVDRRCRASGPLLGDDFGLLPVAPTENTWDRLSGRFHCLAVPYGGGRTTGTLSASGPSG